MESTQAAARREPWNKGKIVGQKVPLKLKDIWALRVHLQMANRVRELALFLTWASLAEVPAQRAVIDHSGDIRVAPAKVSKCLGPDVGHPDEEDSLLAS